MLNKQALARVLAEKAKLQQSPMLNNPMAKPANTMQVNPIGAPAPAVAKPMAPMAPSMPSPGFNAGKPRFANLRSKLRGPGM